jgi:hypothetical protein
MTNHVLDGLYTSGLALIKNIAELLISICKEIVRKLFSEGQTSLHDG